MGEEDEEGEEQACSGTMQEEEGGPDGDVARRGQPVGEQEEGAAGADPAAAGGEDPVGVHPGGSQVCVQSGFLGICLEPRCETVHQRASSAGESRTRAPSEHSETSHPCRGNGGQQSTGDGDNDSPTRSKPKTKTSVQPSRWQRFKQPEQPQHSQRDTDQRDEPAGLQRPDGRADGPNPDEHSDPDHGEHDHPVLLLGLPTDPDSIDALLRKPATDQLWSKWCPCDAGTWKSQYWSSSCLPVMAS